jgi:egghead protein (zeste-white 4 protein)
MENYKKKLIIDDLLYYFSVIFPVALYYFIVLMVSTSGDVIMDTPADLLLFFFKISWLAGILMIPTSFYAWVVYGSPLKREQKNERKYRQWGWDEKNKLVVTYVSRGDNVEALKRSVTSCYSLLENLGVNFRIEVVTDISVRKQLQMFRDRVHFYEVPLHYKTVKVAKYKARALHFALEQRRKHSPADSLDSTWVMHLDEESMLTPQVVYGIAKFIENPDNAEKIGQGEIKYNAYNYFDNYLIGAIDSVRTGDDLGRFRFQFKLFGLPLSGMHGSFMLVPARIEHAIGFDLGGKGSITEDAYFALLANEMGYRFGWVEGFIREQSPFTLGDLIKQRRRWFCGLEILAFDRNIAFKRRFYLIISLLFWKISWIAVYVTAINLILGGTYFPLILVYTSAIVTGGYFSAYMIGVYRNLLDTDFSIFKKIRIYIITYLLVPIAALVEGVAVVYAIAQPVKGFEVVRK